MSTVTFRGSTIRYIDVRREEAGLFTRLHLTADFSAPVCQVMKWEALMSDGVDSAKLSGELIASHFVMTPADKKLAAANETQMNCSDVGDFKFVRKAADEDGNGGRDELRFILRTREKGAAGILADIWDRIGEAPCALKVTYSAQMALGETAEASDSDASDEDEKGEVKEEAEGAPALASRVQMAGSTAELKRKRGRPRKVTEFAAVRGGKEIARGGLTVEVDTWRRDDDFGVEVIREADGAEAIPEYLRPIPSDPEVKRSGAQTDEIAEGVPRFIAPVN